MCQTELRGLPQIRMGHRPITLTVARPISLDGEYIQAVHHHIALRCISARQDDMRDARPPAAARVNEMHSSRGDSKRSKLTSGYTTCIDKLQFKADCICL